MLLYEEASANFRLLKAKPFSYHVPRHKPKTGEKGRHFNSTVGFGLLLLMFLFGFIGAAGQGSDAFSQSHEAAQVAQMMTGRDLSSTSRDGLLTTDDASIENHRKTHAIGSVEGDTGPNKQDDFNNSISRKSKEFLDRKETNSQENSHVQVEHIQFDTYLGGSDKKAEEGSGDVSKADSSEPMTFAQNLKAKLKESQTQLLPVVPIQLPSPDGSHRYHYTDDEDSEFNSFSQFASSHSHLDNVDFVFGNNSLYSKRRKKTKSSIQKYIFPDSDAEDEEYHIKRASLPILKTKATKKPSLPESSSNSTDNFLALASSENFPPLHFFDNIVDEYPFRVNYNINSKKHSANQQISSSSSENGELEDLSDSSSHHNHNYYRAYHNRNKNRKDKHNYRINELNNSNKYADYKDNSKDHEDDNTKENESSSNRPRLDSEEEIVVKRQADEIFRIPIPNSTSATKPSNSKSEIFHESLSNGDSDDEEIDYNLSSIASSTFGLREHPKIAKSIHPTYNPFINKTTIGDDRESPTVEIDDAREDRSEESRDFKNNNDNQREISNKLRDSFSDSGDSEEDQDFSEGNANSNSLMRRRPRRSVVHLYDMVVCATGCNPLMYKGYGCYCGFLGSGLTVDGIDKCCAKHDWCYHHAKCPPLLTYFVPYYWTCNDNRPKCVTDYRGWKGICGTHLCECDRQFAECLRKFPCPRSRAMCMTSPWRFWQNLLMSPPYRYGK